jgi:hypothetical protein
MTRTELKSAQRTKRCPVGLWWGKVRAGEDLPDLEESSMGQLPAAEEDAPERSAVVHVDELDGRPRVVAEILSDGTVQVLDRAGEAESVSPWASGVIAGPRWTIWWERRRWSDR